MNSKEASTKRFISRIGVNIGVSAFFEVSEAAIIGDDQIKVYETLGLIPGVILHKENSLKDLKVSEISTGLIVLSSPLEEDLAIGSLLTLDSESSAIFTSPGRDVTRDTIEMNRRLRVPVDLTITYSSIVTYGVSRYFVTGYQRGDSSLSIGLKLINAQIDWYAKDPAFATQKPEINEDVVNWGDTSDQSWPSSPDIVPVKTGIPAYQEQLSLFSNLKEPGYIPSLSRTYIIPKWIQIKAGDYIRADGDMMKVQGIDYTRIRNMQALSVNFSRGVDNDG